MYFVPGKYEHIVNKSPMGHFSHQSSAQSYVLYHYGYLERGNIISFLRIEWPYILKL